MGTESALVFTGPNLDSQYVASGGSAIQIEVVAPVSCTVQVVVTVTLTVLLPVAGDCGLNLIGQFDAQAYSIPFSIQQASSVTRSDGESVALTVPYTAVVTWAAGTHTFNPLWFLVCSQLPDVASVSSYISMVVGADTGEMCVFNPG